MICLLEDATSDEELAEEIRTQGIDRDEMWMTFSDELIEHLRSLVAIVEEHDVPDHVAAIAAKAKRFMQRVDIHGGVWGYEHE